MKCKVKKIKETNDAGRHSNSESVRHLYSRYQSEMLLIMLCMKSMNNAWTDDTSCAIYKVGAIPLSAIIRIFPITFYLVELGWHVVMFVSVSKDMNLRRNEGKLNAAHHTASAKYWFNIIMDNFHFSWCHVVNIRVFRLLCQRWYVSSVIYFVFFFVLYFKKYPHYFDLIDNQSKKENSIFITLSSGQVWRSTEIRMCSTHRSINDLLMLSH